MTEAFLSGCLLGLSGTAVVYWLVRPQASPQPAIPKQWPLRQRLLVNSRERKIWDWLRNAMADQQVMIKLPVTRFTIPAQPAKPSEAEHWYAMLNRVYCTFTVCAADGRVLGCVDVPGRVGMSLSHQAMKRSLLTQCGIPYWVVEPDKLPHAKQIRAAFLGEMPTTSNSERLQVDVRDAAESLQALLSRQRSSKNQGVMDLSDIGDEPLYSQDPRMDPWDQNSFIAPLDSRAADL